MSNVISKDTAHKLWLAHREIEVANTLLAQIAEAAAETERRRETPIERSQQPRYELGVPMGQGGHRILTLAPELAGQILRAHIEEKQRELQDASLLASAELRGFTT